MPSTGERLWVLDGLRRWLPDLRSRPEVGTPSVNAMMTAAYWLVGGTFPLEHDGPEQGRVPQPEPSSSSRADPSARLRPGFLGLQRVTDVRGLPLMADSADAVCGIALQRT